MMFESIEDDGNPSTSEGRSFKAISMPRIGSFIQGHQYATLSLLFSFHFFLHSGEGGNHSDPINGDCIALSHPSVLVRLSILN
uniref:Uncharacterized protein n=1 Tax=Cucumis melo TaxID=3656 RepID=A0A9I9E9B7_CUCME